MSKQPYLTVVVPTMSHRRMDRLWEMILKNTIRPSLVVVTDNTGQGWRPTSTPADVKLEVSVPKKNVGVNAVWTGGIARAPDGLLSILNDDVLISEKFFEHTIRAFRILKKVAVICPTTGRTPGYEEKFRYGIMSRREGWAFTIRTSVAKNLPAMPPDMFVFCGDDWIWECTHRLGWRWAKDYSNVVFHEIGQSMSRELRSLLRADKQICRLRLLYG